MLPWRMHGYINVGYLNVDVKSYDTFDTAGVPIDISATTAVGFSPRWTAQLGLNKALPLGDYGSADFGVTLAYRTQSYVNSPVDLTSQLELAQVQKEHLRTDARIAWLSPGESWEVELVGRNLTDERVLVSSYAVGPFVNGGYSEPRTWFLGVQYRY